MKKRPPVDHQALQALKDVALHDCNRCLQTLGLNPVSHPSDFRKQSLAATFARVFDNRSGKLRLSFNGTSGDERARALMIEQALRSLFLWENATRRGTTSSLMLKLSWSN